MLEKLPSSSSSSSSFLSQQSESIDTIYIKNCEELQFKEINQSLQNWIVPKIPTEEIYRIGNPKVESDYLIKTVE